MLQTRPTLRRFTCVPNEHGFSTARHVNVAPPQQAEQTRDRALQVETKVKDSEAKAGFFSPPPSEATRRK